MIFTFLGPNSPSLSFLFEKTNTTLAHHARNDG